MKLHTEQNDNTKHNRLDMVERMRNTKMNLNAEITSSLVQIYIHECHTLNTHKIKFVLKSLL